jgi:hypothetical protein
MNQIHYFKHENGLSWGAVSPGCFEESIVFWEDKQVGDAQIDLTKTSRANTSFYDRSDSAYEPCSREEYLSARGNAQAAIARFLASFLHTPIPPVSVTLCTSEVIENDLAI